MTGRRGPGDRDPFPSLRDMQDPPLTGEDLIDVLRNLRFDIRSFTWDGKPQVPGSDAAAGFFLDVSTGGAEFHGGVFLATLQLLPIDDTNEGGQLEFKGAGAFTTGMFADRFQDTWRVVIGANAPLQVSDTATIVSVAGVEVARIDADGISSAARGTLGLATKTTDQTGISTIADLTGLTVTVDVKAGRRIRVSAQVLGIQRTSAGVAQAFIREGANTLQTFWRHSLEADEQHTGYGEYIEDVASDASRTFKLSMSTTAGTVDLDLNSSNIAFIHVEDIGPA